MSERIPSLLYEILTTIQQTGSPHLELILILGFTSIVMLLLLCFVMLYCIYSKLP